MAAEYVLKEGNPNVMLCERGIRTFETAYRFTLDLTAVPVLKELTHLPVIVDPSHAAGRRALVMPLSLAAAAAGADGIIVEVHPHPEEAICDGPQQLVRRSASPSTSSRSSARPRSPGKVLLAASALIAAVRAASCRGRRGPDRRLDRPRRARAPRRARCAASIPARGACSTRRSRAARSTRRAARRRGASTAPTSRSSPRRCGALPEAVRGGAGGRRRGLRGDRRRLDQARASSRAIDDPRFIGGHPLAGAETAGVEHARADLFDGATWYLTPTARTGGTALRAPAPAAHATSARGRRRSTPTRTTRLMAIVSHLPHVLANVLVAQAARRAVREGERLPATGPSSATPRAWPAPTPRSGATSTSPTPTRWCAAIDDTVARLGEVRGALAGARRRRRSRPGTTPRATTAGGCSRPTWPAARCTSCACCVPNRPGVVAEVALALGRASVNIVDMALYPAADYATGTIALWIAGERRRGRRRRSSSSALGLHGGAAMNVRFAPDRAAARHAPRAARQVDLAPRGAVRRDDRRARARHRLPRRGRHALDARRRAGAAARWSRTARRRR